MSASAEDFGSQNHWSKQPTIFKKNKTVINNILFDLEGTLTDPKIGITRCIQFSLEHFEVAIPPADQIT